MGWISCIRDKGQISKHWIRKQLVYLCLLSEVTHECVSCDVFISRCFCIGRSIYYGRGKN